jgi:branched-chain amino acid transport system ATP-binding protein
VVPAGLVGAGHRTMPLIGSVGQELVVGPKLLLLDEPSEGLAPRVVETLIEQLKAVQGTGLALLLAEQHAGLVEELASRVYTLKRGTIGDANRPARR